MLFNSYHFLIFFPLVVCLYYIIPKRWKTVWLLISSYYFYMGWNPKYALLILACTIMTYVTGILLEKNVKYTYKKFVFGGCCIFVLGLLVFFKYFQFIWENICYVGGIAGLSLKKVPINIILPVGISFYIFQALGYMIDVYRGKVIAEKNFLRYALFVSFFPQLVAGPIERSDNLLKQIQGIVNRERIKGGQIRDGLVYMLYGFFLKMVLADNLAVFVDNIFERYYFYGSIELILAAAMFGLQIFCDFSSYSAIAIGAAEVMGFHLMENFHAPYFAISIQDFWRRWHISLSTWFRDYLYIPLGGSHCSRTKNYLNIMVTFLISGLWHGANWTFIIWGTLHGLYQIVGKTLFSIKEKIYPSIGIKLGCGSFHIGQVITTFILTTIAWIFFRADSLHVAFSYIYDIFTKWDPWVLTDGSLLTTGFYNGVEWLIVILAITILFSIDYILEKKNMRFDKFLYTQGKLIWITVITSFIILILVFGNYGGYEANAFIYFQF